MRMIVGLLICTGVSALPPVFADPPPTTPPTTQAPTPATPSTAPSTSSPTTPAPATSTASPAADASEARTSPSTPADSAHPTVVVSAAEIDQWEKHFLAEGYKIEMRNGDKYFCRREETLGSRLGGAKYCSTTQQLMVTEKDAKRMTDTYQHQQAQGPSTGVGGH